MLPEKILGLVLAGGQSLRMGQDKALLKPAAFQGKTMLARAWHLLSRHTDACFVSCAKGRQYPDFPCLEDGPGPEGPGRGVLAGLEYATKTGYTSILTLACDMAAMTDHLLERLLIAHLNGPAGNLATLYQNSLSGRVEMLTAVYATAFLPLLRFGMAKGLKSLYWLLPDNRRQILVYGPESSESFINCNTPEDLAKLQRQPDSGNPMN